MEGVIWAKEGAELLACFFCLEEERQLNPLLLLEFWGNAGSDTCCHPSGVSFTR